MAHFAKLDSSNTIEQVIVVNNKECLDSKGKESEAIGIAYCQSLFGSDTNWVQTSYNARIRKNYASIGGAYDEELDAFIPPKPFDSWALNNETCQWEAPVPRPNDDSDYFWDEENQKWIEIPSSLENELIEEVVEDTEEVVPTENLPE